MRALPLIFLLVVAALSASPAVAQQAEAKQAALAANCKPAKLEVLKQVTGRMAEIIYKVGCGNLKDGFVLVQCRDRTCTLMR